MPDHAVIPLKGAARCSSSTDTAISCQKGRRGTTASHIWYRTAVNTTRIWSRERQHHSYGDIFLKKTP
ncbi:unnamed protein product [Soboliphyme baturini]|uniref:Ig-like domain-containing protein n=1 Tax=Soboliphyme baturini TaxID=241478 RepID=A0A183J8H9_9BILA|nr:unnamed protein product [Soboliphyme baturini]